MARPLNQRLFSSFCADMDADHKALLLYMEVRWLSRGRVLKRVFELREQIAFFLRQQNFEVLAKKFSQEKFIPKVAYLADIFDSLNSLNIYLCKVLVLQLLNKPPKLLLQKESSLCDKAMRLEVNTMCSLN